MKLYNIFSQRQMEVIPNTDTINLNDYSTSNKHIQHLTSQIDIHNPEINETIETSVNVYFR
jgi:hypothetical protein